jgi:hypothetical protein
MYPAAIFTDPRFCLKVSPQTTMLRAAMRQEAHMRHYKNYPISVSAIHGQKGSWHAQGIVFDPDPTRESSKVPLREIKRLTSAGIVSLEGPQEAENLALILCQAWIDGREGKPQ